MNKKIISLLVACLLMIVGHLRFGHAAMKTKQADEKTAMEKHMEQVKSSAPKKYQEMLDRAGGAAVKCTDCHVEVQRSKTPGK